jgi:hypothetical protein
MSLFYEDARLDWLTLYNFRITLFFFLFGFLHLLLSFSLSPSLSLISILPHIPCRYYPQKMATRVLYWFRTDLRLHDSPALQAALDLKPEAFFPVWCWDPNVSKQVKQGLSGMILAQ